MKILKNKNTFIRLLSVMLTIILLFNFRGAINVTAAPKTLKLKSVYWDYKVKTANKASKTVKVGKTYKIIVKGKNLRHPENTGNNGLIKFRLPKYGTYQIIVSNFKGADYMYYTLLKHYNSGIGRAPILYNYNPTVCSESYYKTIQERIASGESSEKIEDYSVKGSKTKAILESEMNHYLYFSSDGKATFNFKIKKIKK